MSKVEDSVWTAVEPIINGLGYNIYDVEYLKEGSNWYLRVYIDKAEGICIEDCEVVSRAIDDKLDELDPIKTPYSLEVSSPGIERVLRRPEHFEKHIGKEVEVSLFKAIDGNKKIKGILEKFSGDNLEINLDNKEININMKDISVVKTVFNF